MTMTQPPNIFRLTPLWLLIAVFFLAVSSSSSMSESDEEWYMFTATTMARLSQQTQQQRQRQQQQEAPSSSFVCANLKYHLYGTNQRLNREDPCDCQRLHNDAVDEPQQQYYQLACRYDYCPACDPVTGLCAVRDETHTYLVYPTTGSMTIMEEEAMRDLTYEYMYLNATFCRRFVPPSTTIREEDEELVGFDMESIATAAAATSNTTTTNTTTSQRLPPSFCVTNVHYPTTTTASNATRLTIRNDYACQIWIGGDHPTSQNTCRSCSPQVCHDTVDTGRMRTSYDCTNLPQGSKVSYCGLTVLPHQSGVGSLLDSSDLDIVRASPFAAALYNFDACRRLPSADDAEANDNIVIDVDDGSDELADMIGIDVNAGNDEVTTDEDNSTALPSTTNVNTTTPSHDAYTSTTVIQSISLSDNGSIMGVGMSTTFVRPQPDDPFQQDEILVDAHVKVYHQHDSSNMNWTLNGLPLQLEDRRQVTKNESSGDVFVRLTPTGQTMVVGHTNQRHDWDVHTRAYNGWPSVGNMDRNMDSTTSTSTPFTTFRYKVHQRFAIANHGTTVARVNRPLPGSFHTYASTPLVEVWDLVEKTTSSNILAGGTGEWQLRPTTDDDLSPVESIHMSDVSLSANGLRYAAGATGLPFVFVKEWQSNTTTTNSTTTKGIWVQIGTSLTADDRVNHLVEGFGYRVSLSSDGSRLAVGGYTFARFFDFDQASGDWVQRGSDVEYPDKVQGELCVSSEGNVFAIGQGQFGTNGTSGRLTTYQWDEDNGDWSLRGVFHGLGAGDYFGRICSVSGNGSTVAAAGSMEAEGRLAGYVEIFSIHDGLDTYSETPSSQPSRSPSTEPSLVLVSRPRPSMAPTLLPTHGVDSLALSSDGRKVGIAEWTLRQRPTIISLLGVATINEKNASDGTWNVVSESNPSGLYVEAFDKNMHTIALDMTPEGIVMFDNYFDLLVYNTSGPYFIPLGEEITWFSGFSRTVISDNSVTVASVSIKDHHSTQSRAEVFVHDFLWNYELGGSEWVQRGEAISYWNTAVNRSGISLASDGLTMGLASGMSSARVIRWDRDASSWTRIGQDLTAADRNIDGISFGAEVLLSNDVTKLAVSAHTFARMYSFNVTSWTQRGNDIDFDGGLEGVLCGSPTNDVFAVGQPFFGPDQSGRVTIYQYDGDDWAIVGFMDGIAAEDNFGNVCAVSADGSVVAAAGTIETASRVRGYVEVFSVKDLAGMPIQNETSTTVPPTEVFLVAVTDAKNSTETSFSIPAPSSPSSSPSTVTSFPQEVTEEGIGVDKEDEPPQIQEASSGRKWLDFDRSLVLLLFPLLRCL